MSEGHTEPEGSRDWRVILVDWVEARWRWLILALLNGVFGGKDTTVLRGNVLGELLPGHLRPPSRWRPASFWCARHGAARR